ncbi:hypothetical protein [Escherichia sp. E2586]|uniref:hypothetical protein n=1 Tax=Escherichia sp. E2586 TaxID=2044457 RepID=UPI001F0F03E9|nr:hypothetical protein [Escherichia sp. E2586]
MLIAVILFVALLCVGMPVGMVIAISSLSYFFTADFLPVGIAFQKFFCTHSIISYSGDATFFYWSAIC